MSTDTEITKIGAAENQLEAAFYLLICGAPAEPVHTLIAAARGILHGLARNSPNLVLEKWDKSILAQVVGDDPKKIAEYRNRVANFLKHADRDPDGILRNHDLAGLNIIELQITIVALGFVHRELSSYLNLALWYFSFDSDALIPFDLLKPEKKELEAWGILGHFSREDWKSALKELYIRNTAQRSSK